MAKKIRLIDDETETTGSAFTAADIKQLMKFAEAIDWKLWEILKLVRESKEEDE
jgi:hypothetical protein